MEKVEKVLLLAVLGVALLIVAVMSLLPDDVKNPERSEPKAAPDPVVVESQDRGSKSLGQIAKDEAPTKFEPEVDVTEREPVEQAPPPAPPAPPVNRESMQYVTQLEKTDNPDFYEYEVKAGESLSTILDRVCGSTRVFDEVVRVNEVLALNPDRLSVGTRLLIPRRCVLSESERASRRRASQGASPEVVGPPVTPEAERYAVKAGDSLWRIAAARVESKRIKAYIAKLIRLNPKAGGTLHIGQQLRLPKP